MSVLSACGATPEPRSPSANGGSTRFSPVSLTWSGTSVMVTDEDVASLSQQTGFTREELESFGLKTGATLSTPLLQKIAADLQIGDPAEFQRAYSGAFASVQRTADPNERYVHCALLLENFQTWIGWVDQHFSNAGSPSIAGQVKEACTKAEGAEGAQSLQRFQLAIGRLWGHATRVRPALERLNEWNLEKMQGLRASLLLTLDAAHSNDAPLLVGEQLFLGAPSAQTSMRASGRNCNGKLSACRLTFTAKFDDAEVANATHHGLACVGNSVISAEFLVDGDVVIIPLRTRYMTLGCAEETVRLPAMTVRPETGSSAGEGP
jgi:hypothetical protein